MTIKRLLVLLAMVLFAIGLAACELPASTPPPTTLPGEGPMGTLQSELGNIATQTAMAGGGLLVPTTAAPPAVTETPATISEPTATPTQEPTTAAQVSVSSPTPGIPKTYSLQKYEFPFCIARRFNVNQYELLNINGLSLSSKPVVGFTLKIPQTGSPFQGDRSLRDHPTTYTVSAGDNIFKIACLYGDVSPEAIAEVNDLKPPYDLKAGKTLNIP